jgi:hypothetical protein
MNPVTYRFSIVIPLEFHRGQIEACLQRWVRGQSFPRERYEVIAAGCRASLDSAALAVIRAELGANDRLLLYDEPHDVTLSALAALQAAGEALFFSESHVLPAPDVLSLAERRLQAHPEWAGFSCRSLRIAHNAQSAVEADMYEADIRYGMEVHPWRKILDQCFVVRADRYHAAGGFRRELGHFAEWHLAARMHQLGDYIGYAPEIEVRHYYVGHTRELIEFAADFARGELIYFSEFVDDPCREYFQPPAEWQLRDRWRSDLACRAGALAWRAHRARMLQPRHVRWLLGWIVRGHLGLWPALLRAFARFQAAWWVVQSTAHLPVPRPWLRAALLQLNGATVSLERLRFIRGWLGKRAGRVPAWPEQDPRVVAAAGYYPAEERAGRHFRWSEPVAMIELELEAGKYDFRLEWLPDVDGADLTIYVNETPVACVIHDASAVGQFVVSRAGRVRFAWTCAPHRIADHPRLLGLPVTALSWTRTGDAA